MFAQTASFEEWCWRRWTFTCHSLQPWTKETNASDPCRSPTNDPSHILSKSKPFLLPFFSTAHPQLNQHSTSSPEHNTDARWSWPNTALLHVRHHTVVNMNNPCFVLHDLRESRHAEIEMDTWWVALSPVIACLRIIGGHQLVVVMKMEDSADLHHWGLLLSTHLILK